MYTTLRLIRIGWRFSGEETLGMATIKDKQSAWYDTIPVPRMVQNQLGHLFELHIIDLDEKILKALHVILEKRDRRMWVVGTLAVFLLLHVRELDAGRNIYWRRYRDSGGFWIHPSMPTALIDEMVASCNSLLWHYHCSVGQQPLTLNWDSQKSMDLVDNNDTIVISMKALQSYVSKLKQDRLIGRKASDLYEDGNPNSVALTVSSLMFASINDSKVDDFH
ncbi:hypothetical protein M501DRAFT_984603 [Patellaria atrata CBS 101060]|uniref:Uncharacterized protein n=1 Tax=Patellaria atrata CBS 101060 TaxID=1346257 RepID=A0A9P4S0N0_9PEZI|nr:hypothetical protein M501DRAFT_984603 [Patellaria atrata CBS 101060]